jgi:hypothetical protein
MNDRPQDGPCGANDDFYESNERETVREPAYYCAKDMAIQIGTTQSLAQTGWYYENFTSQDAKLLLEKEPEGTFIIRDSSDSNYLYSLSVRTSRGTTSARIVYHKGTFQLDSDERCSARMPKFDSVVHLVDFYVRMTLMGRIGRNRWVESCGRMDLPIMLKKPKMNSALDLKHLCRLSINRNLPKTQNRTKVWKNMDELPLPGLLKSYLKEYPYIS